MCIRDRVQALRRLGDHSQQIDQMFHVHLAAVVGKGIEACLLYTSDAQAQQPVLAVVLPVSEPVQIGAGLAEELALLSLIHI